MANKKTEEGKAENTFSREQLIASQRYENYRDFLKGNLKAGQRYTKAEVDALIEANYGQITGRTGD